MVSTHLITAKKNTHPMKMDVFVLCLFIKWQCKPKCMMVMIDCV